MAHSKQKDGSQSKKSLRRINPPVPNTGFSIDSSRIRLDAYRLITIFLAEESFASLRTGDSDSPADILYLEFARVEVERLLINVAILVRMIDDASREGRTFHEAPNPSVGRLTKTIGDPETYLLLRDACNKIIHATSVQFRKKDGEFSWNDKLEPFVELKGKLGARTWIALIDVQKFCEAVAVTPDLG